MAFRASTFNNHHKRDNVEKSRQVVVVGVSRLLLRDRGMAEDHEPQLPGNSPEPGQEVVERHRVAKARAVQIVRSWTVQNEMRDILERVSASAAKRILDSADPRDTRA